MKHRHENNWTRRWLCVTDTDLYAYTCRACRQCESWCAAGDVRAGWTCAGIFHICRAWCPDGSSCAARGRSCWRRTCCSGCTCTAWAPSCALGCAAGDPPWRQMPEKAIEFRNIISEFRLISHSWWWILISHGGWVSGQLEMLLYPGEDWTARPGGGRLNCPAESAPAWFIVPGLENNHRVKPGRGKSGPGRQTNYTCVHILNSAITYRDIFW